MSSNAFHNNFKSRGRLLTQLALCSNSKVQDLSGSRITLEDQTRHTSSETSETPGPNKILPGEVTTGLYHFQTEDVEDLNEVGLCFNQPGFIPLEDQIICTSSETTENVGLSEVVKVTSGLSKSCELFQTDDVEDVNEVDLYFNQPAFISLEDQIRTSSETTENVSLSEVGETPGPAKSCDISNTDCGSLSDSFLNQSAIIEIDDPDLRQVIESQDFILGDYVVVSSTGSDKPISESPLDDNSITSESEMQRSHSQDEIDEVGIPVIQENEIEAEKRVVEQVEEQVDNPSDNIPKEAYTGRPKKGRKRKFEDQTRETKKRKVNTNEDYITTKGNLKFAKEFRDYQCNCRLKCNQMVSVEERNSIFSNFYKAASYEARCMIVQSLVKEVPIKRKRVVGSERRTTTREYCLANQKVCKNIFMQTLRISSCTIDLALTKKRKCSVEDGRGKAGGHNKLPNIKTEEVIEHISKFPRYISHYCRSETKAEYLHPDTTVPHMYKLYCQEYDNPVSMSLYKQIFYTKFNLKRKPLKKDTCNVCDNLCILKKNGDTPESRLNAETMHKSHIEMAEEARALMKEQFKKANEDKSKETECLSFDLEKTLPLPRIPTNIVFYKRQLWFYNCGIHDSQNRGYCYTWVEGSAGRGAQEVGSCLRKHVLKNVPHGTKYLMLWSDSCGGQNRNIKITLLMKAILEEHPTLEVITHQFLVPGHSFLKNDSDFSDIECCLKTQQRLLRKHVLKNVPHGTKYLMLWSDSCGGQNRNIKITLLMKAILEEHPTLEVITHQFLVPGHSFLKNDSDFSDIECCLKTQQRLYLPDDYIEVIKSCRKKNPLHVEKMETEDFKSTEKLEQAITNRKKGIGGERMNWLKFKVIQVRKSEPFSIFVKTELKEETFVNINIGRKTTKKSTKQNEENKSKRKRDEGCRRSVRPSEVVLQDSNKFFSAKLGVLWPEGKPISKEKLQDLKSMYHLIPKDCVNNFYKGLSSSASVEDDIEGYSGTLDFELE